MQQTRAEAIAAGSRTYFTGKACRHGHLSERKVSNRVCLACESDGGPFSKAQKALMERERYKRNPEASKVRVRQFHKENPNKRREYGASRRASELQATPRWLTDEQKAAIASFYASCPSNMHVDHNAPLNSPLICGLHVPWNLAYLPKRDNLAKSNRLTDAANATLRPDAQGCE